jgi:hypothetical protein
MTWQTARFGLVQAASLLISDLFQHYGLAEPPQISRDGSIIASDWSEPERTSDQHLGTASLRSGDLIQESNAPPLFDVVPFEHGAGARTRAVCAARSLNSTTPYARPRGRLLPRGPQHAELWSVDAGGPPEGFGVGQAQHLRLADGVTVLYDADAAPVRAPAALGGAPGRRGEPAPCARWEPAPG